MQEHGKRYHGGIYNDMYDMICCDEMHPPKCFQENCIKMITSCILFYRVGAYLFSSNLNKHLYKSFFGLQDSSHLF